MGFRGEGLLFYKQTKGVQGKMWQVLLDLFFSCCPRLALLVRFRKYFSEIFPCMVGVGWEDPLSILLFDMYMDDLLESLHAIGEFAFRKESMQKRSLVQTTLMVSPLIPRTYKSASTMWQSD